MQDACKRARPVCGHNGETYNTVCEAYSDRVAVDYQGRCHAVGAVAEFASDSGCDMIPCPALSTQGCIPVTPPGQYNRDRNNIISNVLFHSVVSTLSGAAMFTLTYKALMLYLGFFHTGSQILLR